MKILVENGGYNLLNMGDVAMLKVTLTRLRTLFPGVKLFVFTTDPENLKAMFPEAIPVSPAGRDRYFHTGSVFLGLNHFPKFVYDKFYHLEKHLQRSLPFMSKRSAKFSMRLLRKETGSIDEFIKTINSVDAVVSTGGGFITDHFTLHTTNVLQTLGLAKKLGKPVAIFGQGIGPIKSSRLWQLARTVLPMIDLIAIRESRTSFPLLRSLGVDPNKVMVTGDDAVEVAYQKRSEKIGNSIGLNLRAASYSGISQDNIRTICQVVSDFAQYKSMQIIPIAISLHREESDINTLAGQIYNQVNGGEDLNEPATPEHVINLISQCRIVVTGSYHGGVFALSQGIPVIGIAKSAYYRNKFEGLADQFGCACQVVVIKEVLFLEHFLAALNLAWEQAGKTREPLLKAAECQTVTAQKAYNHFKDLLIH